MNLTCDQKALNEHLALAARAVSNRPTRPILSYVLVTADETAQTITLVGFDEAIAIETRFSATVEQGGTICLPAKLWSEIVSRLPAGAVELSMGGGLMDAYFTVTMTRGKSKYDVRGLPAEDYPTLPKVEGEAASFAAQVLLDGLKGALFAASSDQSKQVLMGVHLLSEADALEFAATDGHRLAVVQGESDTAAIAIDVTVAGNALAALERMLKTAEPTAPVQVHLDDTQVRFELGSQRLISRLLEGQYPNYRGMLPKDFAQQVRVARAPLMTSLERIAVLAESKSDIIKLSITQAAIAVWVDASEVGSGREELPATMLGNADIVFDIAFNVRYLLDGLKSFDSAEVELMMNTPVSPAVLRPARDFAKMGSEPKYLIMPVQIRG